MTLLGQWILVKREAFPDEKNNKDYDDNGQIFLKVSIDQSKKNPFYIHPRYALVICSVPWEQSFLQASARCGYISESQEFPYLISA